MKVGSQTKGRPNIPNFGMSGVIPGANINIEEIIKQATQGGSTAPAQKTPTDYKEKIKFEGSMDGTSDRDISEMTWEEMNKEMNDIRFANRSTWNPAGRNNPLPERYQQLKSQYESVAPISRLEEDYDLFGYNEDYGDNVGEGYLEEGERLKKLIESRRGSQESQQPDSSDASMMEKFKEYFEKMKSQEHQDQSTQVPQPPNPIPQWNMMGPQQPTSPVVAAGPQQPSQFMPRPQIPSEMFGGYGGTAPIVPSMAYAGMGNFPQQPRMPRPRPEYDPDAQPGGPPPPSLAEIMGSMGSIFN